MKMTFKMKSLFIMIPILVVVSLIFTFDSIKTEKEIIRSEIIKRAETVTTLATKTGELPILSGNPELLKSTVSFLRANSEVSSVDFYNSKMELLVHDGLPISKSLPALNPDSPISMAEVEDSFVFYAPVFTVKTKENFDFFLETDSVKVRENIGWIRLGFSKSSMRENERKIVSRGLLLAVIFAMGSSALVYFLISLATRPLGNIVKVANDIAHGDFSQEIESEHQDEIGTLAKAFCAMKSSIRQVLHETNGIILAVQNGDLKTRGNAGDFEGDWKELVIGVNNLTDAFAKANEELHEAKLNLERRVEERTVELVLANSDLQEEITERKRVKEMQAKLEQELRQAQKMEAIGTLAAGIAHDFNNLLTGILGFTQLAMRKAPAGDPLQCDLERIYESGMRAADLVKQILTFSRQSEQKLRAVQIVPIVMEVLKLLRSSLPTTISICQDISIPADGGVILADPTQIHQVLLNLATNASHAMQTHGGVLSIAVSELEADALFVSTHPGLKAGSYVRLTVDDDGHGMNAAVMERIFDPYFTTKAVGDGTGMGLAVVQGIIKSLGGIIMVYSELGRGTSFQIFLPRFSGAIIHELQITEPLPGGNERILLVDDEQPLTELGREMLESLGYRVSITTSSADALAIFRARPWEIDLVITDMTMPGLTGKELAREVIAIRPDIPIILCSGLSTKSSATDAREAGIREFIMKPYVLSSLAAAIRRVLAGNGAY